MRRPAIESQIPDYREINIERLNGDRCRSDACASFFCNQFFCLSSAHFTCDLFFDSRYRGHHCPRSPALLTRNSSLITFDSLSKDNAAV
jgi:hypothetical protein